MTREPGQQHRQQTEKQKIGTFQTPEIATSSRLLRSGLPKLVACTKNATYLLTIVMSLPCTTTIGSTDHYTAHLPPLATQQPTPHAPSDNIYVAIPVVNAVLPPVTGAAQTFHELINGTTTQKNGFNLTAIK